MLECTKEAKTVEAAIDLALAELDCSREQANIEVIQEPVKGIFGLTKMAKVKVTRLNARENSDVRDSKDVEEIQLDEQQIESISKEGNIILRQILNYMSMNTATIQPSFENNVLYFSVVSDAEGLLIGRHGQTLTSLQYLLNRILTHKTGIKCRSVIDVGGYRAKHKMILEKMAKRLAKKVIETKEEEELQAMNAFDRRIIHLCVKDMPEVKTYSLGEGNFRRVVIAPKEK